MRCEIITEKLVVIPESATEVYAISKWLEDYPIKQIEVDPFTHEEEL